MTVDELLAKNPFYSAHRGSGVEFPEHTMAAYESAVAAGADALEVSVQATADGILVCYHDTTLTRMAGLPGAVSDYTYAQLREAVRVKPQAMLGDGWANQPIPLLDDVLKRYLGKIVIFLEPKTNPATDALIDYIPRLDHSLVADYLIWKVYFTNNTTAWAQAQGMRTWAYIDATTALSDMDPFEAYVDYWGVPHTATDAVITGVVNRGKPVIVWEVARRSDRNRFAALGVQGMMTPSVLYMKHESSQILSRDKWVTRVKAPGDLALENYIDTYALKYDVDGWAYFDQMTRPAALIGSQSFPTFPANGYRITFDMKYDVVPAATLHAGIAFGKMSDDYYRFSESLSTGGYHIALRGNGDFQLYSHTPGSPNGTLLAQALLSGTPVAGQAMSFQVDVTPTQLVVTRTDVNPDVVLTSANALYRGGYIHLSGGSVTVAAQKPKFRNFVVTAL